MKRTQSIPADTRTLLLGAFTVIIASIAFGQEPSYPPEQTVRIWDAFTPAVLRARVEPNWPVVTGKVQGVVLVDLWIDRNGNVTAAKIVRSIPIIDAEVLAAVRQWRFAPASVGNTHIAVVQQIGIRFPPASDR